MTTESKQAVEGPKADNLQSEPKQKSAPSTSNRKPAPPRAQAKPATARRSARTSASTATANKSSASDSSRLRDNATRAEALEHENVAVQNKKTTHSHVDITDVSGVIVPSDSVEMKETQAVSPIKDEQEEKHLHKKDKKKHHSKDKKAHLLPTAGETNQQMDHDKKDPVKQLEVLQRKALKSEKKVNKLKKKVHKAEKKDIKPSKIRALKEKLTKAFAKWQRRKKKVEATQG